MLRSTALLLVASLAACALPPRETDRSTPKGTFRTFKGALARAEYEREWDCLSDGLRAQLGLTSRLDWKNARAVALTQSHIAVKGLKRAKITGPMETLPDGRVRLPIGVDAIFVQLKGTITLRREVVLRAWLPGQEEPELDQRLPDLQLTLARDGLGVVMPRDLMELLFPESGEMMTRLERGTELSRFEAAWIWFLDGFTIGEDDPSRIQAELEEQREG
ncbi:MAG: hypothetical protein AAGD14_07905 [Planctomycetota bacterium]